MNLWQRNLRTPKNKQIKKQKNKCLPYTLPATTWSVPTISRLFASFILSSRILKRTILCNVEAQEAACNVCQDNPKEHECHYIFFATYLCKIQVSKYQMFITKGCLNFDSHLNTKHGGKLHCNTSDVVCCHETRCYEIISHSL